MPEELWSVELEDASIITIYARNFKELLRKPTIEFQLNKVIRIEKVEFKKEVRIIPNTKLYYIQDSRSYVGNSVLWWHNSGSGYTINIEDAMKVDKEWIGRASDILWPCIAIDKLATKHFDMQLLRQIEKEIK